MKPQVYRVTMSLTSDLHCGGDRVSNLLKIVRDPSTGSPYLPASTLRGVVRSELSRILDGNHESLIREVPENTCNCSECQLFGPPKLEGSPFVEGSLRFFDFHPRNKTHPVMRTTVTVDRETETVYAKAGHREMESIPRGTELEGYFVLRQPEHAPLIKTGLRMAGEFGIGGHRSRGLGGATFIVEDASMNDLVSFYRLEVKDDE